MDDGLDDVGGGPGRVRRAEHNGIRNISGRAVERYCPAEMRPGCRFFAASHHNSRVRTPVFRSTSG